MEKARPWCGQLSDQERLRNRTEQDACIMCRTKIANTNWRQGNIVNSSLISYFQTIPAFLGHRLPMTY